MSHDQVSSQVQSQFASEYPSRSLFAHFDFQRPTLPSSSKSGIRRWTGKWHTSPQDYYYLYDDDTCLLNPTFKQRKPHIKSVFPEYELDELQDTSSTASVLRVDGNDFENADGWSTIAIASVKSPERNEEEEFEEEEVEVASDMVGKPARLTIEKIEKRGSIAKKQRARKHGSAFPAKAKQFFTSIKSVFQSKPAKSSHLSMIEIPSQKEQSITMENTEVDGIPVDTEYCVAGMSVEKGNSQDVIDGTSKTAEDENVSPDATSRKIRSDTWQDDDIIMKRKDVGNIVVKPKVEKGMVTEIEGKSRNMAVFKTTISFQENRGIANCKFDAM